MKSILQEMRKDLCDTFNKYNMPIDMKYYILKDVFNEVSSVFEEYLNAPEPELESNTTSKINKTDQNIHQDVPINELINTDKLAELMEKDNSNEVTVQIPLDNWSEEIEEKEKSNKDQAD